MKDTMGSPSAGFKNSGSLSSEVLTSFVIYEETSNIQSPKDCSGEITYLQGNPMAYPCFYNGVGTRQYCVVDGENSTVYTETYSSSSTCEGTPDKVTTVSHKCKLGEYANEHYACTNSTSYTNLGAKGVTVM